MVQGYQADFAKHAGRVNASHINSVFANVPIQMGKTIDGNVGRYRFKGVVPNRSKYSQLQGPIDWLIKARLVLPVHLVERPEIPLKSFARQNLFKLYLFDVGLLGCMLDLPVATILGQSFSTVRGYFAEGLVAQELTVAGQSALYCWRGRQAEIEFLVVQEGEIVPVEVKAGVQARSRSLVAYTEKYSPRLRVKITGRNLDRRHSDFVNLPLYLARHAIGEVPISMQHATHRV